MRFKTAFERILFIMPLLCATLLWGTASLAVSGAIESPLDEMIAGADPGQKIGVILVMADKVDNAALNQQLKDNHATLEQRHYQVITALQQKAALTQGPVQRALNDLEAQGQVEKIRNFWIANMIAFHATPEAIRTLADLEPVEKIVFDFPVETIKPIIDDSQPPVIATRSQGLDVINAPAVWAMGYTGQGRLVANIDTGVDGTHPALSSRWRGNNGHPAWQCWFDPVDGYSTPTDHGQHGTHTMGTICGRSSTTYDTVGVAINAQWIAAGAVDYGGTTADIIASFQFMADPDINPATTDDMPDAVGNSWGYSPFFHSVPHCDDTFWAAIDGCENAGVVVIFSAGNEGDYSGPNTPNSLRTPADRATTYFNAFSVGAIDGHTAGYPIADFSSRGPCQCGSGDLNIKPECVAPGVNVRSSVPGGSYESNWSGTSMASPHITGSVALIRQADPDIDVDAIKQILMLSCEDLGPAGEDNTYGHGVLNLQTAVQLALNGLGYIDGYVRDDVYNTPLPATVSIPGTSFSTQANSSGYFCLLATPDATYTVVASYPGFGSDQHQVYVSENDTTSQDFYLQPPIIQYYPISYNVSIPPGESTTRDLVIKNIGAGQVYYTLSTETFDLLNLGGREAKTEKLAVALPEPIGYKPADESKPGSVAEPYYPPMTLDQGGPDTFGHTWVDSDEPGGPSVSWIDISSQGTAVSLGDDDFAGPISIGFSFPFYNNNYASLYICSNGMLSFGSGSTDMTNDNIPNTTDPDNFIAPFWDDIDPNDGGTIRYYYDSTNGRFIVSYLAVPFYQWPYGTGSLTFQVVLYPNGNIDFNYGTMTPGNNDLQSASVGLEDINAGDGLQIAYNASYMHSNLSIRINSNLWLSASPGGGSVNAGDSAIATITFDATELPEGLYSGNVNLISNAPNDPNADIPVTLHVSEEPAPLINLNVAAIYDTVFSGYSTSFDLIISNTGDADLIFSTSDNRSWISESPSGGTVAPTTSDTVDVIFNATSLSPGNYNGTLTVSSNDNIYPSINIPCYLFVDLLLTDDVGVSEIFSPSGYMIDGQEYPISLEITNFGLNPQTFDAVFEAHFLGSSSVAFAETLSIFNMPDNSLDTVEFAEPFIPAVETTYTFLAYSTLAGDLVAANDTSAAEGESYDALLVWYGHVNGSAISAPVGGRVLVNAYAQTPVSVYVASLHLCLGTDDQYIVDHFSQTEGQLHYPVSEWDNAFFLPAQSGSPNPPGWSSQSFAGFARLNSESDSPWLHTEVPLNILTYVLLTDDDDGLIGQTQPALSYGFSSLQGPSNASDTLGQNFIPVAENFSPLHFTAQAIGYSYLTGDANMYNETVNLGDPLTGPWRVGGDVTFLVNYFNTSSGNQPCLMYNSAAPDEGQIENGYLFAAGDATGDCQVLGGDASRLVQYFSGNPEATIEWCGYDKPDPENYYPPLWLNNRGSGGSQPVPPLEELPAGWPNCPGSPGIAGSPDQGSKTTSTGIITLPTTAPRPTQ